MMNLNSVPWSSRDFSLLNQNWNPLNVSGDEHQPTRQPLPLTPFHHMRETCLLKYHYQMSIISQRKHAVDLVLTLNLKMLWILIHWMDSLVQKDLQPFTLRDPLTRLQQEELIARFTIARKMRFVCTNHCCLRSLSEREELLTLPKQTSLLHILWSPKLQPAAYCSQLPHETLNQVSLAPFLSLALLYFAIHNIQMLEGHHLFSDISCQN